MKSIDIYKKYKDDNVSRIVIVKEGIFYKVYSSDALIVWYLFDYKYSNDCVSFGVSSYVKVIDKLQKLGLGYIVVSTDGLLDRCIGDNDVYEHYSFLADKCFKKTEWKDELCKILSDLIDKDLNNYQVIKNFLERIDG